MAIRKLMLIAVSAMSLAGCAGQFAPEYGQSPEQQASDTLYCKSVAQGITPPLPESGFYASGSPQFVRNAGIAYGGAALIVGIAHAAEVADNYSLCMTSRGYQQVKPQ